MGPEDQGFLQELGVLGLVTSGAILQPYILRMGWTAIPLAAHIK